jgi:hypothetical protein
MAARPAAAEPVAAPAQQPTVQITISH